VKFVVDVAVEVLLRKETIQQRWYNCCVGSGCVGVRWRCFDAVDAEDDFVCGKGKSQRRKRQQ
jgi:hypothetical protein